MATGARLLLALAGLLVSAPAIADPATPFDATAIRTIPILDILRKKSGHMYAALDPRWNEAERTAALREIAAMTPDRRTLFWLVMFEKDFEYPQSVGDRDGLDWFFYTDGGAYVAEVRDALLRAGLARESALLAQGIGLFHPTYPLDPKERQGLYLASHAGDTSRFDERRLVALAQVFDDRPTLAARITAYIAATPELAAWAETQRASLSDYDRLDQLTHHLDQESGASDFATLRTWPAPYRNIRLAVACSEILEDGDLSVLFKWDDEDWVLATIDALRTVGLPAAAAQIEAGMKLFPSPYPRSLKERFHLERADNAALERRLNKLDGPLCDAQEPELVAYAKREGVLPR